ncbi:MAG: hypothetical protein ABIH37_00950 [archaeon]
MNKNNKLIWTIVIIIILVIIVFFLFNGNQSEEEIKDNNKNVNSDIESMSDGQLIDTEYVSEDTIQLGDVV